MTDINTVWRRKERCGGVGEGRGWKDGGGGRWAARARKLISLARHELWPREREMVSIGSDKTSTTNLCAGRAILRATNQLSRCASRVSSSTSRKGGGAGRESVS